MLFSRGRGFFLVLLAAWQARGPSVHYDACRDSWPSFVAVLRAFNIAELSCFLKGLRSASLSRADVTPAPLSDIFTRSDLSL